MADEPTFDVFVSYSHDDEAWARRLFAELEDRELSFRTADVPSVKGSAQDAVNAGIVGSRVPVVLWSPAAQQSEMVSREVELLGDRPRLVLSLGLGPETPWGNAIADPVAPETYEQGPDALAPDKWKGIGSVIERAVRRAAGQAAGFKLSRSVDGLSRRLRGDVTGAEIVADLISTHSGYARGQGRTYGLGTEPDVSLRQPVGAWLDEVSAVIDATKQDVVAWSPGDPRTGPVLPPLGRRLMASGLFEAIESELRQRLDDILTERGRRAREALEPVPLAGYVADSQLGEDMFDLRPEVAALCAVVSAESVHPPLSIRSVHLGERKELLHAADAEGDRPHRGPLQAVPRRRAGGPVLRGDRADRLQRLRHYLDANLWASLMARIWEGLAAHGGDTPDPRLKELLKRLETSTTLMDEAERDAAEAQQRVSDAQARLDDLAKERAAASDKLGELSARDVVHEVANDAAVKEAIVAVERAAGLSPNTLDLAAVRGLASDRHGVGRARAGLADPQAPQCLAHAFVVLGVVLLAIGIALVFARECVQSAAAVVVAALGIVTTPLGRSRP